MHLGYYKQRHWVVLQFIQFSFLNLDFKLFCLDLWILRFDDFSLELIFFELLFKDLLSF